MKPPPAIVISRVIIVVITIALLLLVMLILVRTELAGHQSAATRPMTGELHVPVGTSGT
jgi:hypothetical protein